MEQLVQGIKRFVSNDEGVAMVEYGLLGALVAVACVTVLTTLGGDLNTVFGKINTALSK